MGRRLSRTLPHGGSSQAPGGRSTCTTSRAAEPCHASARPNVIHKTSMGWPWILTSDKPRFFWRIDMWVDATRGSGTCAPGSAYAVGRTKQGSLRTAQQKAALAGKESNRTPAPSNASIVPVLWRWHGPRGLDKVASRRPKPNSELWRPPRLHHEAHEAVAQHCRHDRHDCCTFGGRWHKSN